MLVIKVLGVLAIVFAIAHLSVLGYCLVVNRKRKFEDKYIELSKSISIYTNCTGVDLLPAIYIDGGINKVAISISWIVVTIDIVYVLKTNTDVSIEIEDIIRR